MDETHEEILRAIGNEIVRIRQAAERTAAAANWLVAIALLSILAGAVVWWAIGETDSTFG